MLNSFDAVVISFLNGFAHRSWTLDRVVDLVSDNYLLKGAVPASLIWWGWFRKGERASRNRALLLSGLIAGFFAFVVARACAEILPFRERPLHNAALHFQLPYGEIANTLIGWSSFPSDHAAVFFALAMAIYFVSRTAGIFALCHAFFIICLPRIYLGFHYPTDILVGALIGVSTACLLQRLTLRTDATRPAMDWIERRPEISYALLFFVTFQIAVSFDSIRKIGHFVVAIWHASAASPN
jgi:undecaprenyl-diphosphatase